jgi:hypothetical protein
MAEHAAYDATLDPRTGRPVLPLAEENSRKADAESQPLTDADNQGIDMGDDDDTALEAGRVEISDPTNDEAGQVESTPSSVDINATVPRMRAAETDNAGEPADEDGEDDISELSDEVVSLDAKNDGERPEALAKFAEVARSEDGRPVRSGVEATAETASIPMDPTLKQDAATRVLREAVSKKDQGAEEAIDRLPDRTDIPGRRPQGR